MGFDKLKMTNIMHSQLLLENVIVSFLTKMYQSSFKVTSKYNLKKYH